MAKVYVNGVEVTPSTKVKGDVESGKNITQQVRDALESQNN